MTWKYLNPGDYRLLDNYNPSSCMNVKSKYVAPVTGVAFGASNNSPTYPINVPSGTKEIWVSFSVSCHNSGTSGGDVPTLILWGATSLSYYSSVAVNVSATWVRASINNSTVFSATRNFEYNTKIWLHIKSGVSDGNLEIALNNVTIYSASNRNVMKGEDILCYLFHTRFVNDFFHDIIFSDEPIDKDEHVVALPIGTTNADGWTYDATNDLYVADSAGKTIWQVPDINQLKKVTGLDNPSVTSVAFQAYNVSTNDTSQVDTLQKAVKQNGQIVTVDSADITTATNLISSAMTVNPVTNVAWTLNDLSNIQLGVTTAKSS